MGVVWVVLFVALTGSHLLNGLPIQASPQTYPHYSGSYFEGWSPHGLYTAVPVMVLVLTALGLVFGCTWCYRHKDCKQPNQGADNQLFTASASHLATRRSNPPDSGFSEPVNNVIGEDNNNGPISLREMQNIANNNAVAYIVSENEDRNGGRESVVEFEPLPTIRVSDPLEICADWFGGDDLPRSQLQYLREIGRGWFGRIVEGEIDEEGVTSSVAVKILNHDASLEDKARFLEEAKMYRDVRHESVLAFLAKCLRDDPWILVFELCNMDLQQYLVENRPKMAILNERGVPLRMMCDVTSALSYLHSRGYVFGYVCTRNVLIRGDADDPRAVLGNYTTAEPEQAIPLTTSSDVWGVGSLMYTVCAWGAPPAAGCAPPDLPCPYRAHLYQVMQLCWSSPAERPTSSQVHALLNHLHSTHSLHSSPEHSSTLFEERWQTLKPNHIPKLDEHIAIVHAPSTSTFLETEDESKDTLSVEAVSRSSSIMSDKLQIKSESLTNLHGSLEDVRNIYLTHNETAVLECHQGNMALEEAREKEQDRSDSSVDPWLKDIIAGSQDDVSYYKDVSDVIKNLDNILNSEKTSSSEDSSHQASPSRDNLVLDCKREYPVVKSMVKSPGITNFQNILSGLDSEDDAPSVEEEVDRETVGTLSHSYERHSDTTSLQTLENLTPDTPVKDLDIDKTENSIEAVVEDYLKTDVSPISEKPKEQIVNSVSELSSERLVAPISSVSEINNEQENVREDCETPCDSKLAEIVPTDKENIESKSIDNNLTSVSLEQTSEQNEHLPVLSEEHLTKKVESQESPETNSYFHPIIDCATESVKDFNKTEHSNIDSTFHNVTFNSLSDNGEKSNELNENITNVHVLIEPQEVSENKRTEDIDKQSNMIETITESTSAKTETCVSDIVNEANFHEPHTQQHATVEIRNENINKEINDLISAVENNLEEKDISSEITDVEICGKVVLDTHTAPVQNAIENIKNLPEPTYLLDNSDIKEQVTLLENNSAPVLPPETVQKNEEITEHDPHATFIQNDVEKWDANSETLTQITSNDSTAYMNLTNDTTSDIKNAAENTTKVIVDENVREAIQSCLDTSNQDDECCFVKNESTEYLDLPSMIKETISFLNSERTLDCQNEEFSEINCASTPKGSCSDTLENSTPKNIDDVMSETKVVEYGPGYTVTKLEQRCVPDNMSPFDSPSKSHHTDTYDENSSVVLGPFEPCSMEIFKAKCNLDPVELPKEELLAFSSNFSEMNLETPSPLRDGNFLNEVPDINTDMQFDDIRTVENHQQTDVTDGQSTSERHVSPSTPPNSPGNFLASTSQKYVAHETSETTPVESDSGHSSSEIDLNQIELQITTKLAMAENENNMNIEYSGPLTVEGLVTEDAVLMRDSDAVPESFLAGNGGSVENLDRLTLDEQCVQALRNELELKLPLAQVASIEPQVDESSWSVELPPPPELIVNYPGALSPIQEETRHQLSAYENDIAWNTSARTDSSESYPEPCNLSTDEVTDLPTGAPLADDNTYTIHSRDQSLCNTFTIQKDPTSKEITMSADSLNGSPYKKPPNENVLSPIDDKTYNKDDEEKVSNCERISQESPFLLSPTEASGFGSSENATGVSTLSKTTAPTDAKLSKPSETQCISKANSSIDSWCSNDTLYNVEENFDDLVMDNDVPIDFENDKSESTDTLTHHDEDKASHCSTYIVHDSKSDACDTFSPDSITAHDNCTYTKPNKEPTQSAKSEVNDSTKNTQTKDLAYETLMSGLPSYSNCTTELLSSGQDAWRQPELVRRSPMKDIVDLTIPNITEDNICIEDSPKLASQPTIKKMDSVEITCLVDNLSDTPNNENIIESHNNINVTNSSHGSQNESDNPAEINDSPDFHYRNMAHSVQSTPLLEIDDETNVEPIPMPLPQVPGIFLNNLPNFRDFEQSAEVRPQDFSSNASNDAVSGNHDTELLLEGESNTLSRNSNRASLMEQTPNYSDFESSALAKPQDLQSRSQSTEDGANSVDFHNFESFVRNCPQDLSSIDASSLLLNSERRISEMTMSSQPSVHFDLSSQTSRTNNQSLNVSPPITNLVESHSLPVSNSIIHLDVEENEQPHSIIITDAPMESPNRTFDSHSVKEEMNHTYDSHGSRSIVYQAKVNGVHETENSCNNITIPKVEVTEHFEEESDEASIKSPVQDAIPNGTELQDEENLEDAICNGGSENFATVQFINENFEELIESNVDDNEHKIPENTSQDTPTSDVVKSPVKEVSVTLQSEMKTNGVTAEEKMTSVTEDFLRNEKEFCRIDSYLPLLSDIRFTGPVEEMSTSFTQDSPTEPESPECEREGKSDVAADILKEWDSDSDSHSTNSSSGEFIWKDGDGRETALLPSTRFDHQRENGTSSNTTNAQDAAGGSGAGSTASGSGSGSGSEGSEMEFVPSSWDCRAEPAKSSLRSLEAATDSKKRVVFKRQKYHCVYEYPREAADADSPAAYLPDFSTYCDWDASSAPHAELGYGQLYGAHSPLDLCPLRAGVAFDYDEDFFISSSARPFESLGVMSTSSQFFPGMHLKPSLLEREREEEDFPPPPSPLLACPSTRTPSLDFTTPDSGVEDITPGSTNEELYKKPEECWRPLDSASSSESVSPSSPGGEALGGLRHTRDKLKLDLPPSPHIPSPRHNRVFNFVLDKPKRRIPDEKPSEDTTPLVMTDETPVITSSLPLQKEDDVAVPEPTFSTFGKCNEKSTESGKEIILDEVKEEEVKEEQVKAVETVKGEGTVLDSGDEDSGIESSSKATLERNKTTPNVS